MRILGVLFVVVAFTIGLATSGYCQTGLNTNFAFGSLNGPTIEFRGESWFIQGGWIMYFIDDDGFDDGWVLRADYVLPFGGGGSTYGGGASPTELAIGYTYIDLDDDFGVNHVESGANVQFSYYFRPNMTFRAGYDHFFDPGPGSIDNLFTAGLMYHF